MENQNNNIFTIALQHIALWLLKTYQFCISPFIGGRAACRFTPTCSEYAKQAIEKYGIYRGCILAVKRILRCRPGGGFGYDPVP